MKGKTHKMAAKRFKATKKGKILKRYCGQDHFNTRDKGTITRKKRRDAQAPGVYSKSLKILLGGKA